MNDTQNPGFLSADYWSNRYIEGSDSWNLGSPSEPLKAYIDQLTNKSLRILIPGCGNAWEAVYLLQSGFTQVTCLDISPVLAERLQEQLAALGLKANVVCGDFFTHKGQYDLVLEQTFFCALDPGLRQAYVEQMHRLLAPGGKLVGVLFDCDFEKEGPPFGGHAADYREQFAPWFTFHMFAPCHNSIEPRSGRELFIMLERRSKNALI